MREITAADLAALVGARLVGDPNAVIGPEVVIDSRQVSPGCLFVALPGERVDGHDYVAAAAEAGAGGVLVSRELATGLPQLVVADTAAGLAQLATAVVSRRVADGMISVGVTGSSGKTSTKDLIAQVLAQTGPTVAPVGSANNEIGAPLTALRVDADTRFLVSELGSRGKGHVHWLCEIVQPALGVVLNIGHAHLGEFGSVAAIAVAKGELVEALPPDGWAVLNADDQLVAAMASRTAARLAAFSVAGEPRFGQLRVWADQIATDNLQQASFRLNVAGETSGEAAVQLKLSGVHQVSNALAAAAVALSQGINLGQVAVSLSRAEAKSRWRMELAETASGTLVVNDAYNANPDSMAAALHAVAGMRRAGGRLVAVLGDMLELGDGAAAAHREVGQLAGELGFDEIFTIGEFAAELADGARDGGVVRVSTGDAVQAVAALTDSIGGLDVVLVKASRGLALEAVAEQLLSYPVTESER
jgi:UDP-N-acetylmuramoyl-tripeptide--D-alanyl-D-alanine ligase